MLKKKNLNSDTYLKTDPFFSNSRGYAYQSNKQQCKEPKMKNQQTCSE